jgi:hypothetical protein
MKIIEAIFKRSALRDFSRCAKQLGIFGFDLSEDSRKLQDHHQRVAVANEQIRNTTARLKVDFAVLDEQTNSTVHAVLESVHPDSISIFKFEQDMRAGSATSRAAIYP